MSCTLGSSGGTCAQLTLDPATNRITKVGNANTSYDAAGDLTSDGTNTYGWDAEGRLISVTSGTATLAMTFNALGQRVYRAPTGLTGPGSLPASYLVDPFGHLVGADWGGWNAAVPLGGKIVAEYGGDANHSIYFLHANALNSNTQTTDAAGNGGQAAILYYPWGEVWQNPLGLYPWTLFGEYASLIIYDPEVDGYQTPFRY